MTDQEKIEGLTKIMEEWTGESEEGFYIPLNRQALAVLFFQKYPDNLIEGREIIRLVGDKRDYSIG